MDRPVSADPPVARNVLARAPWLAALALALGACGAPDVPPGLQLVLGSPSVLVIRGAEVEVPVTLTRLGGASSAVDLSVTGLPADVTAGFSPATLSGGTLVSTLTLTVAASAGEATTTLTVAATGGGLAADVDLELEVASLTVVGRVERPLARPLVGATVASQGETAFSDATGAFTLTGLSVPYDLVVSSAAGNGGLHVYEGLTTASPVVRPVFAAVFPTAPPLEATVTGPFVAGALGVDEVVIVCIEGVAVPVYGCARRASGDTGYALTAQWFEGALVGARLHAFHLTVDLDDVPVTYLGYETLALDLSDGLVTIAGLDFDPVATTSLTGITQKPASLPNSVLFVSLRLGPNLSLPLTNFVLTTTDFDVLVPDMAGLRYDLTYGATDGADIVYAWEVDVGPSANEVAITVPVQPVAPASGALGVDLATAFTTTDAAGAAVTHVWGPLGAAPMFALTTTRTDVTVPDPALGGFPFPAGLNYQWTLMGHGRGGIEEAAAGGFGDFFRQIVNSSLGGPGIESDRTLAILDDSRDLTFAP